MFDLARNVKHFNEYVRQFFKIIIVFQLARCRIPPLIILHQELKTIRNKRKVWITRAQDENVKIKV